MIRILIKIHLAEAQVSNLYFSTDSSLYYYRTLEDSILQNFGTTKETYDLSYRNYMQDPDKMERIYSRVVDSLSFREALKKLN